MHKNINILQQEAIVLLQQLIATPSLSKNEDATATLIQNFFERYQIENKRIGNNIYALNKFYDSNKQTLLLNSHHDTVKPNGGYTNNPYEAIMQDGKLFGLGSNDAGGCLVSLIVTFIYFYFDTNLQYNLVLVASAEEENSGTNGIEMVLPILGKIDCGIVGEPTLMQMAIAERGLMVIDAIAQGKAGHAARSEGMNAIDIAMQDLQKIKNLQFEKISAILGKTSMQTTIINTPNTLHNLVPDTCNFTIDVRVNELYTLEEVFDILKTELKSTLKARSFRMRSSVIETDHPLIKLGLHMGKTYYGSPTTSDKDLMHFPTLKMGPGDSARSHTADEFIFVNEIEQGIIDYINLVQQLCTT